MIVRKQKQEQVEDALRRSLIVGIVGPRQCGKTTLARSYVEADSPNYFDLEDPSSLARLDAPMTALEELRGLVVIDEVQRKPDLFPILRVLADRSDKKARFLILGSASPELMQKSAESLAGRIEYIELTPFSMIEVQGEAKISDYWSRGGFPRSLLPTNDNDSWQWRQNFIRTFLEIDLASMGIRTPASTIRRFWAMLAHYQGQVFNASEAARSLGVSQTSVIRYLDLLENVFMIRALRPWHENLKKRQVKQPKLYFRDTGLLHAILGICEYDALVTHPKIGSSWEGLVLETIVFLYAPDEVYFWATHAGAELDLLLIKNGKRYGFEMKRSDGPRKTKSMMIAMEDLDLEHLYVIYPGKRPYSLAEGICVVPFEHVIRGYLHLDEEHRPPE